MRRDMRRGKRHSLGGAGGDHRPHDMPAPEAAAEGIARDPPRLLDHRAGGLLQIQRQRQRLPPLGRIGAGVEGMDPFPTLGAQGTDGGAFRWRRRHDSLMLPDQRPGLEAERHIQPIGGPRRVQRQIAPARPPKDLLHHPAPCPPLLQAGRRDDHAEPGVIVTHRKPHGRAEGPLDLVREVDPLAKPQRGGPVLGPVHPADPDRQLVQLRNRLGRDRPRRQAETVHPALRIVMHRRRPFRRRGHAPAASGHTGGGARGKTAWQSPKAEMGLCPILAPLRRQDLPNLPPAATLSVAPPRAPPQNG